MNTPSGIHCLLLWFLHKREDSMGFQFRIADWNIILSSNFWSKNSHYNTTSPRWHIHWSCPYTCSRPSAMLHFMTENCLTHTCHTWVPPRKLRSIITYVGEAWLDNRPKAHAYSTRPPAFETSSNNLIAGRRGQKGICCHTLIWSVLLGYTTWFSRGGGRDGITHCKRCSYLHLYIHNDDRLRVW